MSEYIDKQAFSDELAKLIPRAIESPVRNAYMEGLSAAHSALLGFPAADVAPARHAEWVHSEGGEAHCSECGCTVYGNELSPYCPQCGASMETDA